MIRICLFVLVTSGCATKWVIPEGPVACKKMCEGWDMDFSAIVGIGDQNPMIQQGATACVCTPKGLKKNVSLDPRVAGAAALAAIPSEIGERNADENQRQNSSLSYPSSPQR